MRLFLFFLTSIVSFNAFAGERSAEADNYSVQVIRLCENPETGEQTQFPAHAAQSCPDGFAVYDDLTPAYVEALDDIPPPVLPPQNAGEGTHAD